MLLSEVFLAGTVILSMVPAAAGSRAPLNTLLSLVNFYPSIVWYLVQNPVEPMNHKRPFFMLL